MRLELKLLNVAMALVFPLATRGVPGAAQAAVSIIRRRMWIVTGKRAEITLHRLPNR